MFYTSEEFGTFVKQTMYDLEQFEFKIAYENAIKVPYTIVEETKLLVN